MNPKKIAGTKGPEKIIQEAIIRFLRHEKGWFVKATHGNAFQDGFPDLFCSHVRYGSRWVEVKNPLKYAFTDAQLQYFPQFVAAGSGIWVLTAATEAEYSKLFKPCNWYQYLSVMK